MKEIKTLIRIAKDWEYDFKGDLLEGILDNESIKSFLDTLIDEWIPEWKEENPENEEMYDRYSCRLEALNKEVIEEEYAVIQELIALS
jgi:hypothetical protein